MSAPDKLHQESASQALVYLADNGIKILQLRPGVYSHRGQTVTLKDLVHKANCIRQKQGLPDFVLSSLRAPSPKVVEPRTTSGELCRIQAIKLPESVVRQTCEGPLPEVRFVSPCDLYVEKEYQRPLSQKSVGLIGKIVSGWEWAKFKPPVCAESGSGLVVIDGQHTAVAAAVCGIAKIPVMVVSAARLERRASAFVAHNRDRIAMTAAQIFYGDLAAGDRSARATMDAVVRAGGSVPRNQVQAGKFEVGQITAIDSMRRIEPALLARIVRIAVKAKAAPISKTIMDGLKTALTAKPFAPLVAMSDDILAAALYSLGNVDKASRAHAAETGQGNYRACAALLFKATIMEKAA